jgi:hypothetical protein
MNNQQQPPPPKKKLDRGDVPGWIQVAVVVVPLVAGLLGINAVKQHESGPNPVPTAQGNLVGNWRGSSQLSAYESTSLLMTLTLGDNLTITGEQGGVSRLHRV